jgi:metal-responsive CopG/Arc/MetJ family transcriptional regulator
MRVHIEMDSELIERIDELTGERGRSQFVRDAVVSALERHDRIALIESARGAISPTGHEWDTNPAAWVRAQRRTDPRRTG